MTVLYALVFLILGGCAVAGWLMLLDAPALRPVARVLGAAAWVFFVLATMAALQAAKAHDKMGHWLDAHGIKCCSDLHRECRPVNSFYDEAEGAYRIKLHGKWVLVPAGAVLDTVASPDGSSYACLDQYDGRIRCFVNGAPKS